MPQKLDWRSTWPDSPVLPPDPSARYGEGHERAIVISGGGLAGLAWGSAYLNGLVSAGIDLSTADLVVGTSAGSLLGTELLAKDLGNFHRAFQLAAKSHIFEHIRNDDDPKPSAAHARALFDDADNGDPETLLAIGHAALAAEAPSQYSLFAQMALFVRRLRWPSPALRTTAYDAYTAERHVYSKGGKAHLLHALAASASVPGLMEPVRIGGRRLMDGGMRSGANSDIAVGADRALVIGLVHDPRQGKWTNAPGQWDSEIADLEAAGTRLHTQLPAEDLGDPMDATALPLGLRLGAEQAAEDAAAITEFWAADPQR
ncbi:MAG: patatin-like phospholipase family protein [Candidatus Nanopelagicales bacterium]